MSSTNQKTIRNILMWFGLVLVIMPFIPYLKEYAGLTTVEKAFGTKEGTIITIGFILAVGSKYWHVISASIAKRFSKKLNQ